MRMGNMNMFVFMLFLFGQCSGCSLSYDEIISLNATCAPFDTCSQKRRLGTDSLLLHTCECKQSCIKYGTCCIDSPYNRQCDQKVSSLQETCESFMWTEYSVFAIAKCKRNWNGDQEIKSLCENKKNENLSDPISVLPVTNTKTKTTYKNYFCSLCNDDYDEANLKFWTISVVNFLHPIKLSDNKDKYDRDQLLPDLKYDNETNQWGIMVNKTDHTDHLMTMQGSTERRMTERNVFQPVILMFDWPSHTHNSITVCEADLVSKCHPTWEDKDIENKCYSYMGMIYSSLHTADGTTDNTRRFRNIHCAICNFAYDAAKLNCEAPFGKDSVKGVGRPALSFTLLLDINPSDGDRVGEINRCMLGEVFDPFFKKCRVLRCIKPGYKVRNRKCVPP